MSNLRVETDTIVPQNREQRLSNLKSRNKFFGSSGQIGNLFENNSVKKLPEAELYKIRKVDGAAHHAFYRPFSGAGKLGIGHGCPGENRCFSGTVDIS